MNCSLCEHPNALEVFSQSPSMSTDRRIMERAAQTRVCARCGLIFNALGARDQENAFYAEHYDLHAESVASEWQVYVGGAARGENDAILEFVKTNATLPERGRILEVGCGKGVFLGKFLRAYLGYEGYGVEPSSNAVSYFRGILPDVTIHEGPFHTAPFQGETFEFVATSGVLEHVPDPLGFLRQIRGCIAPGGSAYVGVPNFAAKPDDLLLYDHLTQFTPASLDQFYARVGLRRIARDARDDRVWLWDLVEPCEPSDVAPAAEVAASGRALAEAHAKAVRLGLRRFEALIEDAAQGECAALFGLGVLGLLARQLAGERASCIRFALDDNPHLWGSRKQGLPIHGSEAIGRLGVERVFLSANPCYHARMVKKLVDLGLDAARIYRWDDV